MSTNNATAPQLAAGVDLGGTAINYTLIDNEEKFLIDQLCEHPARSREGPAICLQQIEAALNLAVKKIAPPPADLPFFALDPPGPASSTGVLSARGSTNFVHADWCSYDVRAGLAAKL